MRTNINPYVIPGMIPKDLSTDDLIDLILRATEVSELDFYGKSRYREVVTARQIFCHLTAKYFPLKGVAAIGKILNQNHATVIYARRQVKDLISTNNIEFIALLDRINRDVDERHQKILMKKAAV